MTIEVTPLHEMTSGKLAAQCGHAAQLQAQRAGGLVVPVWEVAADSEPAEHEGAVADFATRYAAAAATTDDLTADERRARSGLLSRQVTLR